ncbi:MAG: hypothetical protein E6G08_05040 [Actinobacteria bacterium]|nr:MAG: hypothetical protein E6G08_05040 [Actinomycetota bacterium]
MRRVPLLVLLALLAAGCGGNKSSAPFPATTATSTHATETAAGTTTAEQPVVLRVYLLRKGVVAPVARSVPRTKAVARAAVEQLLAGPTAAERDAGFGTDVPAAAELRGVTVADRTATVDFSKSFAEGADAAIAQVVYTLTQFPTVSRVRFELDGADMPTLDHPAGRGDYEELTPPLLVESPLPGETVASPLRIAGTANAYEATFQAELLDASGAVLVHKMVMATSGSGQRGTFEETLPYTGGGAGKLVVYEDSAANGSRIHQVEIPLELRP